MVKHLTQIEGISSNQLFEEFSKLRAELSLLTKRHQSNQEDELITRHEASKILKVSLSTLLNWRKSGIITDYRIGNKVRYKKSEILNSLTKINQDDE